MASKISGPAINFYSKNSNLKWIVLVISILISIGSIYYTNVLVEQLKEREKQQVELFAHALEYTLNEQSTENIVFVSEEIIVKNNSIPTIWITKDGEYYHRNIDIPETWREIKIKSFLDSEIEEMKKLYEPIRMTYRTASGKMEDYGYVYYKNSALLTQLIAYPFIQLSVIAVFGFISYLAFNYSKAAEQNRLWVGLAKETAHQLGTPLSSLMAWAEVLKDHPDLKQQGIVDELEKDIQKLTTVTERFSNIGSVPALKKENIITLVNNVANYLRPRVSSKIRIDVYTLSESIFVMLNAPLFEWVIENLCKNSVDAIGSSGVIAIKILRGSEGKVFIDVSDTGKGIPRSSLKMVFKPGFTTKKRGWGLGLALAKRIIETYHNGKIFVKSSEDNSGATFRIVLNAV